MEYAELARAISSLLLTVAIFGSLVWLTGSVFGDGGDRKALAGYIDGTNSVIASVGSPIETTQQSKPLTSPEEEKLLGRMHAYNRSVRRYGTLAREFKLRNKPVLIISNMGVLPSGDVIITLRYDTSELFGYRLLPKADIERIGNNMGNWVNSHSEIIFRHQWLNQLFGKS
jgi:hypothetical protein